MSAPFAPFDMLALAASVAGFRDAPVAVVPGRFVLCAVCIGSGADLLEPERLICPRCGGTGSEYIPARLA
jgi:hypothetical protein